MPQLTYDRLLDPMPPHRSPFSLGQAGACRRRGADQHPRTAAGRLVFGIFAALAEFGRELIRERTVAGLESRAGSRTEGRQESSRCRNPGEAGSVRDDASRDTSVSELCRELGITPVTLYRYVGPQGQLREQGRKVLGS